MNICKVAVLLSSYNGEKYIEEQINSVLNQKNVNITLFVRDDGSKDTTCNLLRNVQKINNNVKIMFGKNKGAAASFFQLVQNVKGFDFYALCDQDDVWDDDKVENALKYLDEFIDVPALYFSSTRVVDEKMNVIEPRSKVLDEGVYSAFRVMLGNNATGCTMVFNDCLRQLVVKYIPQRMIMHDHWIYVICVLVNGFIYYDKKPHISYRQHENNELGNRISVRKKILNSSFFRGKRIRSLIAKQIIQNYAKDIPEKNKVVVEAFADYLNNSKSKRQILKMIWKSDVDLFRKIVSMLEIFVGVF